MKKTKIICTIGPESEDPAIIEQLMKNGMNAARLNFSHGDFEEHGNRIKNIKRIRKDLNMPIAIMLDTKGPEIRLGDFKLGKVELKEGQKFTFTTRDILGDDTIGHISYKNLPNDLHIGDVILVDDGLVGFTVNKIYNTEINCTVLNNGTIGNHKGVNIPGAAINLPALTEKDRADIIFGIESGVDIIAVSFVRKPADVIAIKRVLEENNGSDLLIISKIESREGVKNIDGIIKFSDGIMVARGDLGVEIPVEEVPLVQKMVIEKCNRAGKPVITATQMLDSMMRNPRPTRAEASDVANAVFDGTDCIMLSGETANGRYPVESLKTMARIAERTEQSLNYELMMDKRKLSSSENVANAICYSACTTAAELGASAIIAATMSGYTARTVSKFRPKSPIIGLTPFDRAARGLSICWGVYPVLTDKMCTADDIIAISTEKSLEAGYIKKGDLVVIAAGIPVALAGTTNMLKVQIAGDIIVKGQGVGNEPVYGTARIVEELAEAEGIVQSGDILVIKKLDREYIKILDRVSGIVAEEGGFTSHLAVECISRGIPFITDAKEATKKIKNGMLITLDITRGLVFSGKASAF